MVIMGFLVCFNYTVLRNMKDALVITAAHSGAEVIPYIKLYAMLPLAILITYLFAKLSNRFTQETVFYIITSGFLAFFFVFAFYIYPARDQLHTSPPPSFILNMLPSGLGGFIPMYQNWTFSLFYALSELWGSMVLSVLFWGFANEITKLGEARRFYSALSVAGNTASVLAGQVANYLTQTSYNPNIPFGKDEWEQTMDQQILLVLVAGIITLITFRWMNKNVLNNTDYAGVHEAARPVMPKKKLSMRESFSFLSNSKYLICIATLVIGYNLVINLVEIIWKDQLKVLYPLPSDYNTFLNNTSSISGLISTAFALVIAFLIERFGWTKTALITPVVLFITSIGFFISLFSESALGTYFVTMIGFSPLYITVYLGAMQNALSKACKYSLFDATKEMVFIPLDHDVKLKGKAAIDGIGSRLGKSGGSALYQGLFVCCGSLSACTPYVAALVTFALIAWMYACTSLGLQFKQLIASQDKDALKDLEQVPEERLDLSSAKPAHP